MAVWQPHKLSTKLCRLFDGGYSDVRRFARECGEPEALIEAVTNKPNFRISRECQHRIGTLYAAYLRAHPELYHDPGPVEREPKRNVIEESSPRADERIFTLRKSDGRWLMSVRFPAESVNDSTVEWLWRVLDKADPEAKLKAI